MPEDNTPADDTTDGTATTEDTSGEGGDGGSGGEGGDDSARKLTNAQNAAKRAARDRDKLKAELAALQAKLAEKPAEKATAEQPLDAEAIKKAAQAEIRAEIVRDRAMDKVELAAAKTFANPEIARRLLAANVEEFIADGKVDTDAIKDALDDLLEANPYLAAQPEKRFKGTADQGVRTGKEPTLDAQIAAAVKAGDVREQLRLQNLKMLPQIQKMVSGQA